MADITVTAASVRPLGGAVIRRYAAGGAGTVGNSVYIASDGDVEVTDANSTTTLDTIGLVVGVNGQVGATTWVAGDELDVVLQGPVTGLAGMTPGATAYVSDTAGAVADAAGSNTYIIGKAETATTLFIAPYRVDTIADTSVTAAKLSTTLKTGHIHLPLTGWRLIASNDIPNTAGDAGVLSSNSAPALARVNGATDKKLRISWAASGVVGITTDFVYPPDLDDTAAVVVKVRAAMAGASDTPVLAVNYFESVGDTNAGGNTAAVTGTAVALYSRSIAAGDVGAAPTSATVEIVPAAHGTDALYIYGAWVEYTRK